LNSHILLHASSFCRTVELSVAGRSDRDEEQPPGSRAVKHDVGYPSPEFLRLLVELGKMVEREDRRLEDQSDSLARVETSPRD
jgi:hypothetical protein